MLQGVLSELPPNAGVTSRTHEVAGHGYANIVVFWNQPVRMETTNN
jgi:hypothetical protein